LTSIIAGKVPDSFQDFEMEKEEKARRFRK
jgi:hypothetical protein